ncbi:retrovirus-related Pol polyprotein from transposon 17.6 [Trichonephila clavipes]|nr:retrovirus-related Pol polyprotein from transposon 17.6 [Trichonephila clavipes]
MAFGDSLPQINLGVQGGTQGGSNSGAQRVNPEFRVGSSFRIIPEQYFSGMKNVAEFLENIDNNLTYYEIPTQLACAYLKGHFTGRALDWFEVLGYRVVEDKATDYAHLKQALIEQFPVVRNRSELETRFYASSQKHNQKPSDFVYDLLKIHKILKLEMTEEKLLDHVISRLEPQILDYVEAGKLERQEVTTDTLTIADRRGNSTDLKVKVLRIIGGSIVDAEVVNLIIDSIMKAVDRVVRGTGLSGVRMVKTGIDFMKESKLTLDFDKKSLIIPDDQIKQLPKVEKPVEIGLSNIKLDSPEAYRFAIDYRKLNAITKYPRYPLPVIDDLITKILHTDIMSTLDLKSGYFQLAISPKDIEKTAFITRNGTFAFLRMPFGLSGATPNFQKAIDIILKPVLGRFVMCYMDDVIITSPSFNEHIDHLNQEQFNLFTDASGVGIGAVLNQNHRPIAFASRTLNKAERNYTVTEGECLAVIWALNKFRTYFGSLPDYAALTKLTNGKNLSSRMIRWALKLSEFNIKWEHRPGVQPERCRGRIV